LRRRALFFEGREASVKDFRKRFGRRHRARV
jgi:hypothetical protein